jgi:uncharacterized membrane protein
MVSPGDLGAAGSSAHEDPRLLLRTPLSARSRRARATISAVLVVVDAALLVFIAAGVHGPARFVVGLAVALFVPGWAIIGPLRLASPALEVGLTVAVSLSTLLVAAQLVITARLWHLTALQVAVCLLCLPSIVWQALDGRGPRGARP